MTKRKEAAAVGAGAGSGGGFSESGSDSSQPQNAETTADSSEADGTDTGSSVNGVSGGKYLKDAVYGGLDGIITTFSVVSGVHGTNLSYGVTLVLGLANLLADGLSMATGNYLGTAAEIEFNKRERQTATELIRSDPDSQRDAVRSIYAKRGFRGADLTRAVTIVTSDQEIWLNELVPDQNGSAPSPLAAASVTFASFVAFGLIPLIVYLLALLVPIQTIAACDITQYLPLPLHLLSVPTPLPSSTIEPAAAALAAAVATTATAALLFRLTLCLTGATAFALGAIKARITGTNALLSGLQTLALSALASAVAWGVGYLLKGLCAELEVSPTALR